MLLCKVYKLQLAILEYYMQSKKIKLSLFFFLFTMIREIPLVLELFATRFLEKGRIKQGKFKFT